MYGHGSFGLFGVVTKKSISFVETGYEADNISKSLTLSEVEPFNLLFKCWEYCKAFSFDLCTAIVYSWSNLSPSEFPFKTVFDLLFVISVLLFRWYHAVQLDERRYCILLQFPKQSEKVQFLLVGKLVVKENTYKAVRIRMLPTRWAREGY